MKIEWNEKELDLVRVPKTCEELGLVVAPFESSERYYTHPNSNAFISWD